MTTPLPPLLLTTTSLITNKVQQCWEASLFSGMYTLWEMEAFCHSISQRVKTIILWIWRISFYEAHRKQKKQVCLFVFCTLLSFFLFKEKPPKSGMCMSSLQLPLEIARSCNIFYMYMPNLKSIQIFFPELLKIFLQTKVIFTALKNKQATTTTKLDFYWIWLLKTGTKAGIYNSSSK